MTKQWYQTAKRDYRDELRAAEVDEFKYLGTVVTYNGYCEKDVAELLWAIKRS